MGSKSIWDKALSKVSPTWAGIITAIALFSSGYGAAAYINDTKCEVQLLEREAAFIRSLQELEGIKIGLEHENFLLKQEVKEAARTRVLILENND